MSKKVQPGIDSAAAADAAKLDAVREKIARALADPHPSTSADETFARVDAAIDAAL